MAVIDRVYETFPKTLPEDKRKIYIPLEERMDHSKNRTCPTDFTWYGFQLRAEVDKVVPHGPTKGQLMRDCVPVLFWHSEVPQNKGLVIFSYGRLYGEDFQFDVHTTDTARNLWDRYVNDRSTVEMYISKNAEPRYACVVSHINPVLAYEKKLGGSWFMGNVPWKKTVKVMLNAS